MNKACACCSDCSTIDERTRNMDLGLMATTAINAAKAQRMPCAASAAPSQHHPSAMRGQQPGMLRSQ